MVNPLLLWWCNLYYWEISVLWYFSMTQQKLQLWPTVHLRGVRWHHKCCREKNWSSSWNTWLYVYVRSYKNTLNRHTRILTALYVACGVVESDIYSKNIPSHVSNSGNTIVKPGDIQHWWDVSDTTAWFPQLQHKITDWMRAFKSLAYWMGSSSLLTEWGVVPCSLNGSSSLLTEWGAVPCLLNGEQFLAYWMGSSSLLTEWGAVPHLLNGE